MTEPLRNHGDHGSANAVNAVESTAVAPRLRCGGASAEARRNMLKVSAVPSRRTAVLTVFRGATAINDGTTAEPRRSWRRGTTAVYAVQAPQWHRASGVTGVYVGPKAYIYMTNHK